MPSDDLLLYFQRDVRLVDHWQVRGTHYQLTSEAWLANMDAKRAEVMPILAKAYGPDQARQMVGLPARVLHVLRRVVEDTGAASEWFVSHYLFEKR